MHKKKDHFKAGTIKQVIIIKNAVIIKLMFHTYDYFYRRQTCLDGVILVKFSPIVLMTLCPHAQRPILIPTPPYSMIQNGDSLFCMTLPSR